MVAPAWRALISCILVRASDFHHILMILFEWIRYVWSIRWMDGLNLTTEKREILQKSLLIKEWCISNVITCISSQQSHRSQQQQQQQKPQQQQKQQQHRHHHWTPIQIQIHNSHSNHAIMQLNGKTINYRHARTFLSKHYHLHLIVWYSLFSLNSK